MNVAGGPGLPLGIVSWKRSARWEATMPHTFAALAMEGMTWLEDTTDHDGRMLRVNVTLFRRDDMKSHGLFQDQRLEWWQSLKERNAPS